MLQNPPRAIPSKMRINNSTAKLEETATRRLEATISVENPSNTQRRSIPRVRPGTNKPANSATTAVTVTAWPASASDTPRSVAISVNKLAGRYSAVSNPNTPIASEKTAIHAGAAGSASEKAPGWRLDTALHIQSVIAGISSLHFKPQSRRRKLDDL
ncbi:hypothetical protein PFLmoz3_00661 [Pseudomonas fluorescens]|uniref:Uncharacterized protein n=1 Tax=Pseudomonas fluorescens TaxID=294 RepID=A0A109LKN6_PSEFL|nr:hypothetical protein PFLmoz3_00661 [Pseudomonas fluorescens]